MEQTVFLIETPRGPGPKITWLDALFSATHDYHLWTWRIRFCEQAAKVNKDLKQPRNATLLWNKTHKAALVPITSSSIRKTHHM